MAGVCRKVVMGLLRSGWPCGGVVGRDIDLASVVVSAS